MSTPNFHLNNSDSVTSAIDSTTETEDETQPPIQTALDKLASAALLSGDNAGKFLAKGKKRMKKKFKKNSKDDLEITLIRGFVLCLQHYVLALCLLSLLFTTLSYSIEITLITEFVFYYLY